MKPGDVVTTTPQWMDAGLPAAVYNVELGTGLIAVDPAFKGQPISATPPPTTAEDGGLVSYYESRFATIDGTLNAIVVGNAHEVKALGPFRLQLYFDDCPLEGHSGLAATFILAVDDDHVSIDIVIAAGSTVTASLSATGNVATLNVSATITEAAGQYQIDYTFTSDKEIAFGGDTSLSGPCANISTFGGLGLVNDAAHFTDATVQDYFVAIITHDWID